jgi:hypothetical protein
MAGDGYGVTLDVRLWKGQGYAGSADAQSLASQAECVASSSGPWLDNWLGSVTVGAVAVRGDMYGIAGD